VELEVWVLAVSLVVVYRQESEGNPTVPEAEVLEVACLADPEDFQDQSLA
jgi:hypothetical protein